MPARGAWQNSRRSIAWVIVALAMGIVAPAFADDRTAFLIDRLKSDDFRVRTNAALALGATNEESAVQPLCTALGDAQEVVRQSVAAALKRLAKPSSLGCLRARLGVEPSDAVKLSITRAVETIQAGTTAPATTTTGGSTGGNPLDDPPKTVANAKFYIALSPISNQTGRPQPEIDRIVLLAIKNKLDALGGFQLAPKTEAADAARAVMTKRSMKGYYLSISVDRFDYSNGNLKVTVKVAVSGYPGKDLRGEVPIGMTQTGVRPSDKGAEDNLLGMCAGQAINLFAQNFH